VKIIAGPCQHESYQQSLRIAEHCASVCERYNVDYIFKASYDKANRSHIDGERGVGFNSTLSSFKMMKERNPNLQTLTDIHSVEDVYELTDHFNDAVDVLQIPAFLCRQTDIIQAACETDKIVNIKKGQFLAPWDVSGILSKTEGAREVWITERGTSFGYNNLVVDFNGMQYMLDNYSVPIFFDGTHSAQKPSLLGESSGGNRNDVAGLTRAASALGIVNFFLEVHPDPDNAPSDGPNMIYLDKFEEVVNDIISYSYTR
jgi:2-dehydro-3-deoxyphosphooctonate aldolase (KDO 8-P synthase)